ARGSQSQHALVANAAVLEAGRQIRGKRLVIQLPLDAAEIQTGAVRVRGNGRKQDLLKEVTQRHVRRRQKGERRAKHQVFAPVDIDQLHAVEVGLQVLGF